MAEPGEPPAEVTILSRIVTLGAVYARRPRMYRRLLRYDPDSPLPGGEVEVVPSGGERVVAGELWAAWAGEPVGDSLEDIGR